MTTEPASAPGVDLTVLSPASRKAYHHFRDQAAAARREAKQIRAAHRRGAPGVDRVAQQWDTLADELEALAVERGGHPDQGVLL